MMITACMWRLSVGGQNTPPYRSRFVTVHGKWRVLVCHVSGAKCVDGLFATHVTFGEENLWFLERRGSSEGLLEAARTGTFLIIAELGNPPARHRRVWTGALYVILLV
jgi:hypothetical protein